MNYKHATAFNHWTKVRHVLEPESKGVVLTIQLRPCGTQYLVQWSKDSSLWHYEKELVERVTNKKE